MRLRKTAFWLSVLLIFIIPWESGAIIEGIGPIARIVGLVVTAFWLGVVLVTGRFRRLHPFHILILLFLLWNIVSLFWSINTRQTLAKLETYVQLTVMVFLIWDLYTTQRRVRIGLQAYVLGAYITVWSIIGNYLAGTTTGRSGRFSGFGFNENGLAMILVIGMGIAWYLAVSASTDGQKKWSWEYFLRLANYAFVPLAIFSVTLTASRTAVLSTVPFFWFVLGSTTQLKLPSRLLLAVGMVGALFFLRPLVPQTSIDRLSTTSGELTEGDLNGRRQLWEVGIEAFLERPITGAGSGVFKTIADGKVAHNTYLSILTETGIIGLLFFAIMIVTAVYQIRYQNKLLAVLWLTVFLSWAIGVSAMSWELRKPTWFIIAFVLVSGHAIAQHSAIIKPDTELPKPDFSHSTSVTLN
ncbi:MAG TPA: O-antigen ligase domain-containing protein [Chromatiaceae bacterium]|nr:O-antigen ligase domain-containing protein [Chromatiaceae bacterium]HIP70792.1 O-antigen ligase domain-containing protein [Anaerolineae bacterium]